MTAITLAEKVKRDFSKIKLKRTFVKVPKLKARKKNIGKAEKDDKIPVSTIVNILIKNALENARKEKKPAVESKKYKIKEDMPDIIGGYGTASKGYGASVHAFYVDYGKLFSYLGKFKSQSPYENMAEHLSALNKSSESGRFVLADREAMDRIGRFDKYMKSPVMAIQTMALSLVPIAGLSSAEWEEIKMLMKFDSVLYNLKTKTS